MNNQNLKEKVHKVIKTGYFDSPQDLVDVSNGDGDLIHLVIVSRKFDGQRMMERHHLIWEQLMQNLTPEEWTHISLTVGASPEEVKVIT